MFFVCVIESKMPAGSVASWLLCNGLRFASAV